MKTINISTIWNLEGYNYNHDYLNAFSSYLLIHKNGDKYIIKESLVAKAFSKFFNIKDCMTIYTESIFSYGKFDVEGPDPLYPDKTVGRHHKIEFNYDNLNDILAVCDKYKINYAILDIDKDEILFENFNKYNSFKTLLNLLNESHDLNRTFNKIEEINEYISKGRKKVMLNCKIDLKDMETNEIVKVIITSAYLVPDEYGRLRSEYKKGYIDGYESISKYAPLANSIMGKFENEIININGTDFKIISVRE